MTGFSKMDDGEAQPIAMQPQPAEEKRGGFCDNLNPKPNDLPMPELTAEEEKIYKQLQWIQYAMDDAITVPFTGGHTVGIDPIVGLIPFVGDFSSAIVSCILVARASKVISRYTVTHMLTNVAIDATIGTIPLLGDLFDVGWKANTRNVTIYENHMKLGAQRQRELDKRYVGSMVCVICSCIGVVFFMMASFTVAIVLLIMWATGNLG